MFRFLKIFKKLNSNKNNSMKIHKFYYYSPDKSKLIPIQNFILKATISVALVALLFTATLFGTIKIFSRVNSVKVVNQKFTVEEHLKSELDYLKKKYETLYENHYKILSKSNNLRLAVNLEPIDFNNEEFGTGGSILGDDLILDISEEKEKIDEIYNYIDKIESSIEYQINNYSEIEYKFQENKSLFNILPAIKPVECPIGDRFGIRLHPILKVNRMHYGVDFLANIGEPVHSPGDGIITFVGNTDGYGKVIKIKHGFGYETLYGHLSNFKVRKGDKVKRGDLIALTGNSGKLSTGPHLHYEVRHNGVPLNPRNFIFEDVKLFEVRNTNLALK